MKLSESECAYLAGICDGEGTITIRSQRGSLYQTIVPVSNSNTDIILRVCQLLTKSGIRARLERESRIVPREGYKIMWHVVLRDIDSAKRYLILVCPYLSGKHRQAELLLDFLKFRGRGKHVNRISEKDFLIHAEVICLNKRGTSKSVETNTPNAEITAKIESELTGDRKSAAEMTAPTTKIQ